MKTATMEKADIRNGSQRPENRIRGGRRKKLTATTMLGAAAALGVLIPGTAAAQETGAAAIPTVSAQASAQAQALDHCTGFCVKVHNGLSKSVYMGGNAAQGWVPSGRWSNDAVRGLSDVDWVQVPSGCTLMVYGRTYHSGQRPRIHGFSPRFWLVGNC